MFPVRTTLGQGDEGAQAAFTFAAEDDPAIQEALKQYQGMPGGMQAAMKQLEKSMMDTAIKDAITSAGLQLAISAIPGIGQALSGVMSLIGMWGGKRYERKLNDHMKRKQKELQDYEAAKQSELNKALSSAYKQAYRDGIKLAQSFFSLERDKRTEQERHFAESARRSDHRRVGAFYDKLTGKSGYDKARRQIDTAVTDAKRKISEFADPVIRKVKTSGFRAEMAQAIGRQLRNTPQFMPYASLVSPSDYASEVSNPDSPIYNPNAAAPKTAMPKTLILGGAAVLGAVLFLR